MLQVFVKNPESSEPWALCGSVQDLQETVKAIGHYVQAELENDEKEFTLAFKMVEMTEKEVEALPDM